MASFSSTDNVVSSAEVLQTSLSLWEQGLFEEAVTLLETTETSFPTAAALPARRALFLNQLSRPAEALAAAWKALERDAACPDAQMAKAFALFALGQLEEAEIALEGLLAEAASPDAAWLKAGIVRQRLGDHRQETLTAYETALAAAPENRYIQAERADILRVQGNYTEARTVFARFREPGYCDDETLRTEAMFKFALVAMVQGDDEAAREALQEVVAIAPDYPDAQETLALLCLAT